MDKSRLEDATSTAADTAVVLVATTVPAKSSVQQQQVVGVPVPVGVVPTTTAMTFVKQWNSCSAFKQYDCQGDVDHDHVSTTSSTDTDTDYDYTTSEDEQENEQAQAMVRAAFSRTLSVPALISMQSHSLTRDRVGGGDEPAPKRARVDILQSRPRMPMVDSAPVLLSAVSTVQQTRTSESTSGSVKPDDHLRSLLKLNGLPHGTFCSTKIKEFFLSVTPESVAAYDMEVVKAVREENVEALGSMLKLGRSLQCGNKFGESIVHTACRRASLSVLLFLVNEAGVSVKVCCDYGRTPLHDACWTSAPNFELIRALLKESPDLLHVTDVRGFTPLQYVMRDHWGKWCDFLDRQTVSDLVAKELN